MRLQSTTQCIQTPCSGSKSLRTSPSSAPAHILHVQQHRWIGSSTVARAEPEDITAPASQSTDAVSQADKQAAALYDRSFPKTGLFSIADPNAEVYSKAGEVFDPTKKGGRWKPEFIWQTNWQEALKRQEDLERQQAEYRAKQAAGGIDEEAAKGPGVVSFSRLGTLDDVNVDLSQELIKAKRRKQEEDQKRQAAAAAAAAARQQPGASTSRSSSSRSVKQPARPARQAAGRSPSYEYKDLPTKNEARRFKRSSRLAGPGTVASVSAVGLPSPEEAAARAAEAAAEKVRYEQLKVEFQGWTLGIGLVGGIGCYYLYGTDVAISFALGASSGLQYLRLLTRSVDSVGERGGSLNSAIGQPRLLIPVVLALTYNRWNALYADDYGITLNFYAMLIGFFTYKFAVVGRQGLQLLSDLSAPRQQQQSTGQSSSSDGGSEDAMSLDRIFVRKVMSE